MVARSRWRAVLTLAARICTLRVLAGGEAVESYRSEVFSLALQGILGTFALPDVLRLLAATRKTGCLQVEGDRGRGSVWFDEGCVAAATAGTGASAEPVRSIDEVVFELLRYRRGSFRFSLDEKPQQETGQVLDLESTLLRALQLLDEWHDLEQVVPSLSHRASLVPDLPAGHVSIDSRCWSTLVAIADSTSIGQVAQTLGVGELDVIRSVRDLVEMGVVQVEPPVGARPGSASAPAPSRRETGNGAGASVAASGAVPPPPVATGPRRGNGSDLPSPISTQVMTRPPTGSTPTIDSP